MNISIKIDAPELAGAIQALAAALLEMSKPVSESMPTPETEPTLESTPAPTQVPITKTVQASNQTFTKPAETLTHTITLEEVRAKLAALSQSGKQAQVKALITKFGAKKLTDIPPEKYPELLAEAEGL
ncbi:hypothetical protein [Thermoanaerobacterium sp. DL9XJH110]|uniref:hypothetical protein n=1 Tax=Thermoanaerobacterium sp. DL9XJH110 TaxID=3386643 RepID=UPI003BB52447